MVSSPSTSQKKPVSSVSVKTQPWAFTDTLLTGFFCEVDGDDTIRLDHQELKEGVWLERSELPEQGDVSLTSEMLGLFRDGRA